MSIPHSGVLLVDKPRGMTSHDVVARLRRIAGTRQVGHTGTLDPMADGLLIVCIGPATRISQFLVGLDKVYVGTITLGAISSTYDAEGAIVPQTRPIPEKASAVSEAMASQVGDLIQLPPPYSAIKVHGKKLYEYARNGEPVPQKPREVRVAQFKMIRYAPPEIHFEARVGSGTYIRSMAHDLGLALGCGGYLSQLRRTQVGAFSVEQAVLLETLIAEPTLLPLHLLGVSEALGHLPKVTLQPGVERMVMNGGIFSQREILEFDGILNLGQPVLVLSALGQALSIAAPEPERVEAAAAGEREETEPYVFGASTMIFRPIRVLAPAGQGGVAQE